MPWPASQRPRSYSCLDSPSMAETAVWTARSPVSGVSRPCRTAVSSSSTSDSSAPDAGADDQVQVVILGVPGGPPRCEPADVEVEVLIEFMAGVEVEHRGAQPQRRQQPGLDVVKLGPTGGGAGHVQAPRLYGVDVHSPHDALRIGVGAGQQVERLVFGSVDGAKTSGAGWPHLDMRWSPHGIDGRGVRDRELRISSKRCARSSRRFSGQDASRYAGMSS